MQGWTVSGCNIPWAPSTDALRQKRQQEWAHATAQAVRAHCNRLQCAMIIVTQEYIYCACLTDALVYPQWNVSPHQSSHVVFLHADLDCVFQSSLVQNNLLQYHLKVPAHNTPPTHLSHPLTTHCCLQSEGKSLHLSSYV